MCVSVSVLGRGFAQNKTQRNVNLFLDILAQKTFTGYETDFKVIRTHTLTPRGINCCAVGVVLLLLLLLCQIQIQLQMLNDYSQSVDAGVFCQSVVAAVSRHCELTGLQDATS